MAEEGCVGLFHGLMARKGQIRYCSRRRERKMNLTSADMARILTGTILLLCGSVSADISMTKRGPAQVEDVVFAVRQPKVRRIEAFCGT